MMRGQADTAICPCGNDDQTPEHVLQACPLFDDQRKGVWPDETDLETKLRGTADNLSPNSPIYDIHRATDLTTARRTQKKKKTTDDVK